MRNAETSQNTEKVLVVDDEKSMRVTLAAILRDEGYQVVTAATGDEALELCVKDDFAVVLMDVRMPGIDGVEAFRQIRRHKEEVRVILMSAYSMDVLSRNAYTIVRKPLEVDQILRLLQRITQRHVSGDTRKPTPDM